MHHLTTGMHASVSTPGAEQGHGRVGNFGQRLFEGLLDARYAISLALPAAVARAFVFHAQSDAKEAFGRRFGNRVINDFQEDTACRFSR
ncbi:hypothetical protein D3C72_1985310 [compost metagenome]